MYRSLNSLIMIHCIRYFKVVKLKTSKTTGHSSHDIVLLQTNGTNGVPFACHNPPNINNHNKPEIILGFLGFILSILPT